MSASLLKRYETVSFYSRCYVFCFVFCILFATREVLLLMYSIIRVHLLTSAAARFVVQLLLEDIARIPPPVTACWHCCNASTIIAVCPHTHAKAMELVARLNMQPVVGANHNQSFVSFARGADVAVVVQSLSSLLLSTPVTCLRMATARARLTLTANAHIAALSSCVRQPVVMSLLSSAIHSCCRCCGCCCSAG